MKSKPVQFWKDQIANALRVRKDHEKWWDANLKAYAPQPGESPEHYGECINTNRDFTLVERKKADLFYQRPDVTCKPSPLLDGFIQTGQVDPMTGQPMPLMDPTTGQPIGQHQALQSHQEILNEKLGPDGIDAVRMAHQAIFDVLCTQGVGWTKMGYESVTVEVEQPNPEFERAAQVSAEFAAQGIPVDATAGIKPTVKVPVPIHEHCFWHHFSGKKAVIPHDFRSTEWDKAPWLGYQFELPLTKANRAKYKLSDEFSGGKSSDGTQYYDHGVNSGDSGAQVFTGIEIWYRSALYREDVQHPEHLTQLVLVDGKDAPALEIDSPYQTLDEKGGLTPDSLIGFPIHPLNMRTLTDSAYPPSDCTLIRPLVNELNKFREQMVQFREMSGTKFGYNVESVPPDAIAKIARAPMGGLVGLPAEFFQGEMNFRPLEQGSLPRESYLSNDYVDKDIAQTTGVDASGAGVQSGETSTATEKQIIQANANARLDWERGAVLHWYLKGVTKFSTLLQRYLPVAQAAQIVGESRAQIWDIWRKQVASAVAFTAMPDSALRTDQAVDRDQAMKFYTAMANDPFINRGELLAQLLRKFHLDPAKIVQQPPPKQPEPPKLALSIKMDDFVLPQAPITVEIATQMGLKISPEAVIQSQGMMLQHEQLAAAAATEEKAGKGKDTEHGGMMAGLEPLSKHQVDATGGMQGTGAKAPMGAGGGMLQ